MKCQPVALESCSTRLRLLKMQAEGLAMIKPKSLIKARISLALDVACKDAYVAQCSPQGSCGAEFEASVKLNMDRVKRIEVCKRFAESMSEAEVEGVVGGGTGSAGWARGFEGGEGRGVKAADTAVAAGEAMAAAHKACIANGGSPKEC